MVHRCSTTDIDVVQAGRAVSLKCLTANLNVVAGHNNLKFLTACHAHRKFRSSSEIHH